MPSLRPSLRMLVGVGLAGGAPLAMGADGPSLVPIIVSGVGALMAYVIAIALRVRSARAHARAKFKRELGQQYLADGDATNDSRGRELLLDAAEDDAEAQALDDVADRKPRL